MGNFSHKPEKKINAVASENSPLQAIQTPGKLLVTKKEAISWGSYNKGIFINSDNPMND